MCDVATSSISTISAQTGHNLAYWPGYRARQGTLEKELGIAALEGVTVLLPTAIARHLEVARSGRRGQSMHVTNTALRALSAADLDVGDRGSAPHNTISSSLAMAADGGCISSDTRNRSATRPAASAAAFAARSSFLRRSIFLCSAFMIRTSAAHLGLRLGGCNKESWHKKNQ